MCACREPCRARRTLCGAYALTPATERGLAAGCVTSSARAPSQSVRTSAPGVQDALPAGVANFPELTQPPFAGEFLASALCAGLLVLISVRRVAAAATRGPDAGHGRERQPDVSSRSATPTSAGVAATMTADAAIPAEHDHSACAVAVQVASRAP